MNTEQVVSLIKRVVAAYANVHLDKSDCKEITEDDKKWENKCIKIEEAE